MRFRLSTMMWLVVVVTAFLSGRTSMWRGMERTRKIEAAAINYVSACEASFPPATVGAQEALHYAAVPSDVTRQWTNKIETELQLIELLSDRGIKVTKYKKDLEHERKLVKVLGTVDRP